jgi:hypothetical protein
MKKILPALKGDGEIYLSHPAIIRQANRVYHMTG